MKDHIKHIIGCRDNLKKVCEASDLENNPVNLYQRKHRTSPINHLNLFFQILSLHAITYEYSKYSVLKFMSKKPQALEKFIEYVGESGLPQRPRQTREQNSENTEIQK